MSPESVTFRGGWRNRVVAVVVSVLFVGLGLLCGFFVVREARAADSAGAWFTVATMSVVSVLCALLGIRYGLQCLSGRRVVTTLDREGIRIDRRAIGGGVLVVRWADVESIHRNKFALGLVLRSPGGVLRESDEAELRRIADTGLLLRIGIALKLTSGLQDAVEVLVSDGGAAQAARADTELGRRVLRALAIGRRLGGYDIAIPYWELDRGAGAMADLLERHRVAASGGSPLPAAG